MKVSSRVAVVGLVALILSLPAFAQAAAHGGGFHGGGVHGGAVAAPAFRGAPHAVAPGFRGAPRAFAGRQDFHHDFHGDRGRGRVFIGVGPTFWWDPWPPPYYAAPPVVVQEPPVYVEQSPTGALPQGYWYYCPSVGGYYPDVPSCPEPWVPVTPSGG